MKTSTKLSLLTLLLFGAGGYLVIEYAQDQDFLEVLESGRGINTQLMTGLIAGMLASVVAVGLISRRFFKEEMECYKGLIDQLNLRFLDIIFLSLCAGIGEELFFRGGIQPFLGIWWTSILFVLLHGYLNPKNWRISIYGMVMVGIIAGFGFLFRDIGLISAMTAHAVLDIVLLIYITSYAPE
ncbi:CPBP family intramembrane metalloprotease [Membranicola marinus]|uniref:CPBP family intramembrane metalloprotease n=1 Tax=Membranihabitans marinus TaxID=1227546 RepID=A0A953HU76_9BACT|nr:CPBP family intramembrane glutamic endopeptidase [Membranihabitans marinus]MBY5957963.1 CPBP family intramembrane metalloprotease [Membranihabitans marinus]